MPRRRQARAAARQRRFEHFNLLAHRLEGNRLAAVGLLQPAFLRLGSRQLFTHVGDIANRLFADHFELAAQRRHFGRRHRRPTGRLVSGLHTLRVPAQLLHFAFAHRQFGTQCIALLLQVLLVLRRTRVDQGLQACHLFFQRLALLAMLFQLFAQGFLNLLMLQQLLFMGAQRLCNLVFEIDRARLSSSLSLTASCRVSSSMLAAFSASIGSTALHGPPPGRFRSSRRWESSRTSALWPSASFDAGGFLCDPGLQRRVLSGQTLYLIPQLRGLGLRLLLCSRQRACSQRAPQPSLSSVRAAAAVLCRGRQRCRQPHAAVRRICASSCRVRAWTSCSASSATHHRPPRAVAGRRFPPAAGRAQRAMPVRQAPIRTAPPRIAVAAGRTVVRLLQPPSGQTRIVIQNASATRPPEPAAARLGLRRFKL